MGNMNAIWKLMSILHHFNGCCMCWHISMAAACVMSIFSGGIAHGRIPMVAVWLLKPVAVFLIWSYTLNSSPLPKNFLCSYIVYILSNYQTCQVPLNKTRINNTETRKAKSVYRCTLTLATIALQNRHVPKPFCWLSSWCIRTRAKDEFSLFWRKYFW